MLFAGIDPGFTGYLAVLDDSGRPLQHIQCPILGTRSKPLDFDLAGIRDALADLLRTAPDGRILVALENPPEVTRVPFVDKAGNRKTRAIHATKLREGFRCWQMALVALRIPYVLFPPKEWQKDAHVGVSKDLDPKDRSCLAASRFFPDLALTPGRKTKPDHDLAEAHLIAEIARRRHNGTAR